MRALITGGRGFVGSWLDEHLREQGDTTVVVDREVDVTDRRAVDRAVHEAAPDAIYHLAALTHVGESWSDPDLVFEVNALGTMHVLDAARRLDPGPSGPRVLLVSSAEVYGVVGDQDLPVDETASLAPVTPYAASKVAAEFIGVQARLAHGLHVVRVRPFNHIGPGQGPGFVVPALAQRIVEASRCGSSSIAVGNLSARRDVTDVRDVVRAYRLLVEHGQPGEVYNVCSGTAVSIAELAARLLDLAGAGLELVADPELFRPVDVPVVCGDPTRVNRATGWSPRVELDHTLADVLEQWRSSETVA